MKTLFIAAAFVSALSTSAFAEVIYESNDYYDGLGSCNTKISKSLTMSIDVVCSTGSSTGSGTCSGHELNDYFACASGSERGNADNAEAAVNWLLNAINRQR